MHQRFGTLNQPLERLLARALLEVKVDAALVAVQVQHRAAHARVPKRAVGAKGVAFGGLDLAHIGSHVPQDPRPIWAHDDAGEVDHTHATERAGVCGGPALGNM